MRTPALGHRGVAVLVVVLTLLGGAVLAVTLLRDGGPGGPDGVTGKLPRSTSTEVPRAAASTGDLEVPGSALPALAPAVGFASGVTGGEGGSVYRVTSADDTATSPRPGTLRYGLSGTGPTWVVFDRDLTIRLEAPLPVPSDTTIDGRGHDVELTGHGVAGLQVYDVENVIVENLTLHDFGDVARTKANDPADAIDIQRSSRVWIDHCSLSVAGDKLIAVEDGGEGLTFSWNHFSEQEQTVQIGALFSARNDVAATVTLHHNWFDHVAYRTPVVQYAKAHVYNNFLDGWSVSGVRSERLAQVYLENNVFRPDGNRRAALVKPAQTCNDKHTLCDGRSGYLASVGNLVDGKAFIRENRPSAVFAPRTAYDYTAEKASADLAERVSDGAGARSGTVG